MLGNARTATMAGLNALGLALAACSGGASTGDSAASTDRDAAVWSCTDGGGVVRIDPATNEVAATVEVVEELHAPEVSGRFVLVAYHSVWTTAHNDAVHYRIAPTP